MSKATIIAHRYNNPNIDFLEHLGKEKFEETMAELTKQLFAEEIDYIHILITNEDKK